MAFVLFQFRLLLSLKAEIFEPSCILFLVTLNPLNFQV